MLFCKFYGIFFFSKIIHDIFVSSTFHHPVVKRNLRLNYQCTFYYEKKRFFFFQSNGITTQEYLTKLIFFLY